jgi:CDP-diacylglycerol--glycerol-3-phosphate 3-phosphatidyltransferase
MVTKEKKSQRTRELGKKIQNEIKKESKDFWPMVLQNIPNFLTISRLILTFVLIHMIFVGRDIILIMIVFVVAALTDFFDGQLARRFNWTSEFGRKADMIADRFLWVGTALAFFISFSVKGILNWTHTLQLFLIMSRELISAPFVVVAFFSGNPVPQARYIAKVTTFLQGFALPLIILSIFYPAFAWAAWPISIACCVTGIMSGLYYLQDIKAPKRRN